MCSMAHVLALVVDLGPISWSGMGLGWVGIRYGRGGGGGGGE